MIPVITAIAIVLMRRAHTLYFSPGRVYSDHCSHPRQPKRWPVATSVVCEDVWAKAFST